MNGKTVFYHDPTNTNVANVIMAKGEELGADCIVLGIANYANHKLGSVSEEIIKNSKVNVVCFKDQTEAEERKLVSGALHTNSVFTR